VCLLNLGLWEVNLLDYNTVPCEWLARREVTLTPHGVSRASRLQYFPSSHAFWISWPGLKSFHLSHFEAKRVRTPCEETPVFSFGDPANPDLHIAPIRLVSRRFLVHD
jgi:hypothetical protein